MATAVDKLRALFGVADRQTPAPRQTGAGSGIELTLDELLRLRLKVGDSPFRQRKRVTASRSASHRSHALGRGLDFAEVRAYQPGDDVRLIDWNVTARTNQVHTKLFEEEKERPVFIVVDFCQPMLFGTRVALKSVAAARLAAQLAWISSAAGERVGGVVFSEHRHSEIKPVAGSRGTLRLLHAMIEMHRECTTRYESRIAAADNTFDEALKRLRKIAHPGSLVFLLSDFSGLSARSEQVLKWLCAHTECIAARVVDALEVQLPDSGLYPVTNGVASGRFDAGERSVRAAHGAEYARRNAQLTRLFSGHGAFFAQYNAVQAVTPAAYGLLRRNEFEPPAKSNSLETG